ncbi:MAG: hypothetical protein U0736_25660 [Gemmataceae bacterium]
MGAAVELGELKSFAGAAGHKGIVLAVALSPDGTQFATGGADNTARVWDFPAAKHLRAFAHDANPRVVAVSADGNRLALGGKDGTIRVWTKLADEQSLTLTGHTGAVTGLAFSPNGTTLVSVGGDGTLRYWNAVDGKPLATVAAHPRRVGGRVQPWRQRRLHRRTRWHAAILDAAVDLAARAADVQGAGDVPRRRRRWQHPGRRVGQGGSYWVAEWTDRASSPGAGAHRRRGAPGGSLVAAGTADRQVLLWESKDGGKLLPRQSPHGGAVTGVSFRRRQPAGDGWQGRHAAAVGRPARPPRVAASRRRPRRRAVGRRQAAGHRRADKVVRLYRLDTLKTPERQFSGHAGAVNAVAVLGDGKLIASAGDDETVRLWACRAASRSARSARTARGRRAVAVGAEQFATAGADGGARAVASAGGEGRRRGPLSHAGGVTSFALSADGGKLLTGSAPTKQVRLWNLAKGQVERRGPGRHSA